MVPLTFWLTNIHLIISAFGAYAFFVMFWLQIENPITRRQKQIQLRSIGLFLLGVAFILHGFKVVIFEQWHIASAILGSAIVAMSFISAHTTGTKRKKPINPKLLMWAIILLLFSTILEVPHLFASLHNEEISTLFSAFGVTWYIEHVTLAAGVFLFSRWVWLHLKYRALPQVYMTIIAVGLLSFFFSTVIFTNILYNTSEEQALTSLEVNARVMDLTFKDIAKHTQLAASALAGQDTLIHAVANNAPEDIQKAIRNPLEAYNVSAVYIINSAGEIMLTVGGNMDTGTSLSNEPMVTKVLAGERTGAPTKELSDEPRIVIRGGAPLVQNGNVIGGVLMETPVDTALVDYIKSVTGLSITTYIDGKRLATTLRDETNQPLTPINLEDPQINDIVLQRNSSYTGISTIASHPYFVFAAPITDFTQKPIGILLAGIPEASLINSIKNVSLIGFLFTLLMAVLTLIPFYIISRLLQKHITDLR